MRIRYIYPCICLLVSIQKLTIIKASLASFCLVHLKCPVGVFWKGSIFGIQIVVAQPLIKWLWLCSLCEKTRNGMLTLSCNAMKGSV